MIGKTIKSILVNNSALTTLVPAVRMFPYVMNEDTVLPAIIYTISSLTPEYSKGGWALDNIEFSVHSFARDYASLQSIVAAVRTALELNRTGSGTQGIGPILLTGMEEGYDQVADVYGNKLEFTVRTNKY
jgi:hypothetical protein